MPVGKKFASALAFLHCGWLEACLEAGFWRAPVVCFSCSACMWTAALIAEEGVVPGDGGQPHFSCRAEARSALIPSGVSQCSDMVSKMAWGKWSPFWKYLMFVWKKSSSRRISWSIPFPSKIPLVFLPNKTFTPACPVVREASGEVPAGVRAEGGAWRLRQGPGAPRDKQVCSDSRLLLSQFPGL